jgi:hypothetical protein
LAVKLDAKSTPNRNTPLGLGLPPLELPLPDPPPLLHATATVHATAAAVNHLRRALSILHAPLTTHPGAVIAA